MPLYYVNKNAFSLKLNQSKLITQIVWQSQVVQQQMTGQSGLNRVNHCKIDPKPPARHCKPP